MTQLQYLKKDIISKINDVLGEDTVTDMVFKAGSIKEEGSRPCKMKVRAVTRKEKLFIKGTVSGIKDKSLRGLIKKVMVKGKSMEG
jgi:hypothetical protein